MIDNISFHDKFWFQLESHLISFGFKDLPKDVHFTISYHHKSPDINLHLSKNVKTINEKPQIKIVIIEKNLIFEDILILTQKLLNTILEPIDLEYTNKNPQNFGFISFSTLEKLMRSRTLKLKILSIFKETFKVRKKTHLKINNEFENNIVSFANSQELQNLIYENISEFPIFCSDDLNGGIIIFDDNAIMVYCISGKWYKLRTNIKSIEFLEILVNSEVAKMIIWKTRRAIISLSKSQKYSDIADHNVPIRLTRV